MYPRFGFGSVNLSVGAKGDASVVGLVTADDGRYRQAVLLTVARQAMINSGKGCLKRGMASGLKISENQSDCEIAQAKVHRNATVR